MTKQIPTVNQLGPRQGLAVVSQLRKGFGGILPMLEQVARELGEVCLLSLPGFSTVLLSGPDPIRQMLVEQRDAFLWRPEGDPVTKLLRGGLLVTDGEAHTRLRAVMEPSSQRKHFAPKAALIREETDRIVDGWQAGECYDMLVEMRKVALLIFERVYFSHDLLPELDRLWTPILKALSYISPGLWILRPGGIADPPAEIDVLDQHLHALIDNRRADANPPDDLLTHLVQALDDDNLVRDQMLTMLIAGHDTSTALLAWTLFLLGQYPEWMARVQSEVRSTLGEDAPDAENTRQLHLLEQVIKESLRLYPPIHMGNRFTARDVTLAGYDLPSNTRVMYSIYLVQRHPEYWANPSDFRPERFAPGFQKQVMPFSYLPFGGGQRNCIGGSFAQLEARIVLARILQRVELSPMSTKITPHMGATLEPHPGVEMGVENRSA